MSAARAKPPAAKADKTLVEELKTFHRLLPTLAQDENKWALIAGTKLLGIYDTYADALAEGYKERQMEPFLVKRISANEVIYQFSRGFSAPCRILRTQ